MRQLVEVEGLPKVVHDFPVERRVSLVQFLMDKTAEPFIRLQCTYYFEAMLNERLTGSRSP